jgi:hypothetical protein
MVISGRLNSNLTIKNGWGIQAFSFFRGRQVQLQGYQGGFGYYSVGVKKDFKNKRGSLGMAGENFFNNPFSFEESAWQANMFSSWSGSASSMVGPCNDTLHWF